MRKRVPGTVEPMPTRRGDIVIAHDDTVRSLYAVWRVMADGQQACGDHAASYAIGRAGAVGLARLMVLESLRAVFRGCRAATFLLDTHSGQWNTLAAGARRSWNDHQ